MAHLFVAIFGLLQAAVPSDAAQALLNNICQDGSTFAGDQMMDADMSCGDAVTGFMSDWMERTELSEEECATMVGPTGEEMPAYLAMFHVQMKCCDPINVGSGVVCNNYPAGNVCEAPNHFRAGEGLEGMFHCSGDESLKEQSACQVGGQSAWDFEEGECDVGRLEVSEEDQAQACATLGGSWEEYKCFEFHAWFLSLGLFGAEPLQCLPEDALAMLPMLGASCCKQDGEPAAVRTDLPPACADEGSQPAPAEGGGGSCHRISGQDLRRLEAGGGAVRRC